VVVVVVVAASAAAAVAAVEIVMESTHHLAIECVPLSGNDSYF
jgi:hypothetical protein